MTSAKLRKIKRMRKLRRERRMAFSVLTIISVLFICFVFNAQTKANEKFNVSTVKVGYGDTLWSIAKEYKPDGENMHKFINQISEFNDITNATIHVGQTIYIPQN